MSPDGVWKSMGGAARGCAALFLCVVAVVPLSACGGGGGGMGGNDGGGGGSGPGPGGGGELFLRGSFNDWDARTPWRFAAADGGSYVLTVALSRGAHEFKIADAGWSARNNFGGEVVADVGGRATLIRRGDSANKVLVAAADGAYVFRFNPGTGALDIVGALAVDGAYRPGGGAGDKFNNLRTYQVMVESFRNGDDSADYNVGWGPSAHRGDLRGIIGALDHIVSLNVNALWLTPIFDSRPQNGAPTKLDATGYYARNYFAVDPHFGAMDDARTLVSLAHARGLSVFFDGVFGHWHRDGVVPRDGLAPAAKGPIGGIGHLADYDDPDTVEFFKTVATFWIDELGIDGWRLDQAYQVPIEAWREIRAATDAAAVRNGRPTVHLFGEFWRSREEINREAYGTDERPALESALDFPGRELIFQNVFAAAQPQAEALRAAMLLQRHYPAHARPGMFVGNHDLPRFGDLLQRAGVGLDDDNPGAEYWARHRLAASFLAAHTGPIFTYYGEEIGRQLPGFVHAPADCGTGTRWCDDHVARDDGKIDGFTAAERALRDYYAETLSLRAAHPALWNGAGFNLRAAGALYADLKVWRGARPDDDEAVMHLMNLGAAPLTLTLAATELRAAGGRATLLTDLRNGATTAPDDGGNFIMELPPFSARLLSVAADSSALLRHARVVDGKDGGGEGRERWEGWEGWEGWELWENSYLELSPPVAGLAAGLAELNVSLALPDGRFASARPDARRVVVPRRRLSAPDAWAQFRAASREPPPPRPALGGQLRGTTDGFAYEKIIAAAGGRFALEYQPRRFSASDSDFNVNFNSASASASAFARFGGGGMFFPATGESPHLHLIPGGTRALAELPIAGGRLRAMFFAETAADADGRWPDFSPADGARAAALEWRGGSGAWRFGALAGGLRERGRFLGARGAGALAPGNSATFFGGLWGERRFGDAALFLAADGGRSRTTATTGALKFARARTSAFAGGMRMDDVFHAADRLVVAAHAPLRAAAGAAQTPWRATGVPLKPAGRETAVEMTYYFPGAFAAGATAEKWRGGWGWAYRRHPGHNPRAPSTTAGFVSLQAEF